MTTSSILGGLIIGFAAAIVGRADDVKGDERVEHARAFITELAKKDFEAAAKDFDEAMVKALPGDKLEKLWQDLIEKFGSFKKLGEAKKDKTDKYEIVRVACEFEKAQLTIRVVYDNDGKIGGFSVAPSQPAFEFNPPRYARKDAFHETELTITTGEWALPGTLTLPKGEGPFPAVVLVHGSGPNDRDETIGPNKILRDLAWGLASRGIAVLRYDKRTLVMRNKLAKAPEGITLKEETVDDAASAVAILAKQKEIDKKHIFVLGHSLGAYALPRIGLAAPESAGLILMAGNSRPLEDLILEQTTYLVGRSDVPEEKRKEKLDALKKQVELVKNPKLSADTPSKDLPLGIQAEYWLDLRKYDAAGIAAKLKQPMLILQGERDYQVTMVDFEGWKKALAKRTNVKFKSYPKLNHLFMEGEGKSQPDEYQKPGHVAPEVIDDIAEWVKRQ